RRRERLVGHRSPGGFVVMRLAIFLFGFWVLSSAGFLAQDFIKLKEGGSVLGEIVKEDATSLTVVTKECELVTVAKDSIERERRGKKIHRKVQAMLDAIDAEDNDALFALAQEISETKAYKYDALRFARRIVARDPDHEGARTLLGHVRIQEKWYPDRETAMKALEEKMKADGFVYLNEGWVKVERAEELKAHPEAFILIDELIWRPLAEVMVERGFTLWEGEWYPKEEKYLLVYLERLKTRTGEVAHAAVVGSSHVFAVQGRDVAKEMAKDLDHARNWFCDTFEVGEKSRLDIRNLRTEPQSFAYVLSDQIALSSFADEYKKDLKMDDQNLAFTLPRKHCLWRDLGHAIHTGETLWKNYLVSQLGGSLLDWYWHRGFERPAFLWVGSAHLVEAAVYGAARTQYVAEDKYARTSETPATQRRGISDAKDAARDLLRSKSLEPLSRVFFKTFNELTVSDDIMGVAFLQWCLEERKEILFKFLSGSPSGNLRERFDRTFGAKFDEVDKDFHAWLLKP
ncbi:MAG: hypothetical protein KDB53_07280, partial [Planctomycetes bacterium]|nr:hypothetical protein [Planctomycetota bacterium]